MSREVIFMRKIHLIILVFIFISTYLWGQQRNVKPITVKTNDGKSIALYKNSYALVIGINNYTDGWPRLANAVTDAQEVKQALEEHGFEVNLIENPTAQQLESAIRNFVVSNGKGKDDRLLFYFAGHGYTHRYDWGGEMGYIIPADTPLPGIDMEGFQKKAVIMENFNTYARAINSKHALFIFDSCFSGSIFALARAAPDAISYKTTQPVRQFITAGSANETVPDRSIFKQQFLEALSGEGDSIKDGYITGSELGEFLQTTVVNYSRESQHPQYGKIRDPNLDKGDFVFVVPKASIAQATNNIPDSEGRRPAPSIFLRKDKQSLDSDDVQSMLKSIGFFDISRNETGIGIAHDYDQLTDILLIDNTTGLMWQRGGSLNFMSYEDAESWIKKRKEEGYAGFNDWRLPTLEEAMSLMEREKNNSDLYINPVFDKDQKQIWTSDLMKGESAAWVVYFYHGICGTIDLDNSNYVRAVRSVQSPDE